MPALLRWLPCFAVEILKLLGKCESTAAMKSLFFRLRHLYQRFFGGIDYLRSPFLLAVRLYWGWQLIESGWGKLHNLEKVKEFFTSLNLPMPGQTAVFISCVELFGGIF